MKSTFILATVLSAIIAQQTNTCTPDLLIDDFLDPKTQQSVVIESGRVDKYLNKLGADYGAAGNDFSFTAGPAGHLSIVAGRDENIGNPEPKSNPGAPLSFNYFFWKNDLMACSDVSKYVAVQFDLMAAMGSNMFITLTQKSKDCKTRLVDSEYKQLTDFVKPNGQSQVVTIPFSGFSKNLLGNDFDFNHLKDVTFVNLTPSGATFLIRNLKMIGTCNSSGNTTSTATSASTSTPTSDKSKSSSATAINSVFEILNLVALVILALI